MKRIALICLCLLFSYQARSQASLAAEDIIDDIPVSTASGDQVSYTLVRDAVQTNQWYYMPAQSRLYEIKTAGSGKPEPEFTFIKYQYNDPKNPGQLLEGGVLQFAIVMSPDNVALQGLRNALIQKTGNQKVQLAALPLKEAHVRLVTPKGEFIAEGTETEGIAPLMANQKMVFSLKLPKIGADVYEALVNSNTGMGVATNFTYTGLTPPAGFTITVDWDESYKFFSKNEVSRASISGMYSWLSGSAEYKKEKQQIIQQLQENKCIKVNATTGEGFTDSMLYAYIDPILKKISTELFTTSDFNRRMDSMLVAASLAQDTSRRRDKDGSLLNFLKISAGKSVAIKDISLTKKGKEEVSFNIKHLVERKSIAGGFVGLGRYPQDVRDRLTVVVAGKWESAYFVLPPISDDEDVGVKRVAMEIKLTNKDKYYSSQVFNWTKEKGWTDKDGTTRTVAAFPLLELAKDDPEMKDKAFEVKATINVGNDVVEVMQRQQAGNSENNIALPLTLVDVVKVDPDLLSFRSLVPTAKLDFVTVSVTDGEHVKKSTLKPRSVNGTPSSPKPFFYLTPKSTNPTKPLTANIVFALADGSNVPWKFNNKNLRDPDMSYEVVLRDIDYLGSENPQGGH